MDDPWLDPNHNKASFWVARAADALDCAIQLAPDQASSDEINDLEVRCDALATELKKRNR